MGEWGGVANRLFLEETREKQEVIPLESKIGFSSFSPFFLFFFPSINALPNFPCRIFSILCTESPKS